MSASKVYFTDMRCPVGTGLLDKLKKLIEKAGIDSIDMDSKFVAIKIHSVSRATCPSCVPTLPRWWPTR